MENSIPVPGHSALSERDGIAAAMSRIVACLLLAVVCVADAAYSERSSPEPVPAQTIEELCKLHAALNELEAVVASSRDQLIAQQAALMVRIGEAETAIRACAPAAGCIAGRRDRLIGHAKALLEERNALDGTLAAFEQRLQQQGETRKRLDDLVSGKCP